jgi:hypothetical protein
MGNDPVLERPLAGHMLRLLGLFKGCVEDSERVLPEA